MLKNIKTISMTIDYIETHLQEKLELDAVADAVHYSKYHLHRMFTNIAGMTIHDYIQRRRLSEAAKLLVCSNTPILDIALLAGYNSQQSFTDVFKAMYKRSPHQYRTEQIFYPLQLRYTLNENPSMEEIQWRKRIVLAKHDDIPLWMDLVHLVIDGFPYLDEQDYLKQLHSCIEQRQAFILKDTDIAIGVMAFCAKTGRIDFLGVHPQYKKQSITKAFLQKISSELIPPATSITITTFREGDKADTGYRDSLKCLGFAEAELLTEFGYPTQRLVLSMDLPQGMDHA